MLKENENLTENDVVEYVVTWLTEKRYAINGTCKNTARGDDIAATSPSGDKLFVECKGSISRHGNRLDEWHNTAMALFGAIVETEHKRPNDTHVIAVPHTHAYHSLFDPLIKSGFLIRQRIVLFWVHANGGIDVLGADFG